MAESSLQLVFASKQELMTSISQIYDSLIDITEEIDKLHTMLKSVERNQNELTTHVSHIRNIISKDLTMRAASPHAMTTTLLNLKMSQEQWQKYINSPTSLSSHDGRESNSQSQDGRDSNSESNRSGTGSHNNERMTDIADKLNRDSTRTGSISRNNDRRPDIVDNNNDLNRSGASSRNNDRRAEIVDKSAINK